MNRKGMSGCWRIGLQIVLLVGLVVAWLSPVVQAQQSLHPVVRPFYIGFEDNNSRGVGCGQSLFLGSSHTDNNKLVAFRFLVEYGDYTKEQAAGIVGNLEAESGVDPQVNQRGGPGRGIAQWEASDAGGSGRWDTLLEFAEILGLDERDLGTQLSFIVYELQGKSKLGGQGALSGAGGWGHEELVRTTSVDGAAEVFVWRFEIPYFIINMPEEEPEKTEAEEARAAGIMHRQRLARDVFEAFKDIGTTPRNLEVDIRCTSYSTVTYGVNGCPESAVWVRGDEIINVSNSIGGNVGVHRCVQANIEQLFVDINRDLVGIDVSGYGWRSNDQQRALRRSNCGTWVKNEATGEQEYVEPTEDEIMNKSSRGCSPETARPGHSRHQRGVAIDFSVRGGGAICYKKAVCDGQDPESHHSVFNWLKNNAARYGLEKLSSEAWHWSIDGS